MNRINRRLFIIAGIIVVALVVVISLFSRSSTTVLENEVVISEQPQYAQINEIVTEIDLNDKKTITTVGTKEILNTDQYVALYHPNDNAISLIITTSPFEDIRIIAEENLIDELGLSKEEACQIKVEVLTPSYANENESGVVFPLSFCSE